MGIAKKEAATLFVSVVTILMLLSLVSAGITVSKLDPAYNLGDDFSFTLTVNPNVDTSDFLTADLVCGNSETNLYRSPVAVSGGELKEVLIEGKLDRFLVGQMSGICLVRASYSGESSNSQTFEITGGITITAELSGFVFDPGEEINITGRAFKKTGNSVNGFVDVSFSSSNDSSSGRVTDGSFGITYQISDTIPGAEYNLVIKVYDVDNKGNVLNEGFSIQPIRIKQVVRSVDIAISEQTLTPGNDLVYTPLIYDQAGNPIERDLEINLYNPDNELHQKFIVKSGVANRLQIATNFSSGYWSIEAILEDKDNSKSFFVEEMSKLSYDLEDETLSISNIGNVPFSKPLKITIGEVTEIKDLFLSVGQKKKFKLSAPDGEYDIKIGDSEEELELGRVILTGNAISINEIGSFLSGKLKIIIWIIVILVLATLAVFLYRKISKRKLLGKKSVPFISKSEGVKAPAEDLERHQTDTLIDNGEKQESGVIALKLKNMSVFISKDSPASKALDTALWKAKESGAKIYADKDFRIIVVAPILVRTKDPSVRTISIARAIERVLNEFNKRTPQKVEFGIGANLGELVVESKEGKFKFMSIDNTISVAKRLSQESSGELFVSEKLRKKTLTKVKMKKAINKNHWTVDKIVDRSQHKEFINKFKIRHGKS